MLYICHNVGKPNGTIEAATHNPSLYYMRYYCGEGATDLDVITRLRQRTVPTGYVPHTWNQG